MGFFDSNDEFNIGDKVRVKYRGQEGYIVDKNGSLYMVSLNDGGYVDSYTAHDNEPEIDEISILNELDNITYILFENEIKSIKIISN